MNSNERETAISSLTQLESYYQSKYQHYLAMAMTAKENLGKIELLLQDLLENESYQGEYRVESTSVERKAEELEVSGENGSAKTELSLLSSKIAPTSPTEVSDDELKTKESSALTQIEQMSRLIEDLSQAMSVLKSVTNSDTGKTLHLNYLQKILNQELQQELGIELVELYLEEGIKRGYVKRDEYDRNCYIAQGESSKSKSLTQQNGAVLKPTIEVQKSPRTNQSKKLYNLPSSGKLKPTLLETVNQYIVKCSPKRFSVEDVLNYLYPQKQQLNWSKTQKTKVRQALANVLGRKAYLGKEWNRIKPGIYRPIGQKS